MAAQSILGVPAMRPALLDDLPNPARRGGGSPGGRSETTRRMTFLCKAPLPMLTSPDTDDEDEDDEVLEDEEFDEDSERDEDEDDLDEDEDEEEETWQVGRLDFVG